MTKHVDQGVLKSIVAADEQDDGSKEAQVGGEKTEETAVSSVSSRDVEAAGVAVEEGRTRDAYVLRACGMCGLSGFWVKRLG